MEKLFILCVDDQREVLSTLTQNLSSFENYTVIEDCETADEAWEVMEEIDADGDFLAVIISDHVMPGKNGVEFLTEVKEDDRFSKTKKMLLTGLATHKDTIEAINMAGIDRYMEKPWDGEQLVQIVKELLTQFILAKGIDYQELLEVLDQTILYENLKSKT